MLKPKAIMKMVSHQSHKIQHNVMMWYTYIDTQDRPLIVMVHTLYYTTILEKRKSGSYIDLM